MRRFLALARTAALESLAEPLTAVLFLSGFAVTHLAPAFHYHQFGESGRLARECGFSALLVFGLVFATGAAIRTIGREIESGTAAAALALAVPRTLFLAARLAGVLSTLALFAAAIACATALAHGSSVLAAFARSEHGGSAQAWGPGLAAGVGLTLAALMLASCIGTSRVVPVTGRKQTVSADNATLLSESLTEYKKYVSSSKLSTNANNTAMVKRVGKNLANAVVTYLKNNGYANEVGNYNWEFNLVKDKQVNAFCMPGGKIVVYEGLLPVTQTEAALAIVLGHEIAHAVAYHSSEQFVKAQRTQMIGQGINVIGSMVTGTNTSATVSTISQLYGLGSQMATLKYSRDNETEADRIGLIFAAMAGYDPNVAVSFWQRMASSSNNSTPTWLSTHPSDAQRIANIQKCLPEALKYYKKK